MHNMPKLWDAATLKFHTQAVIGRAENAQSEQDWKRATVYAERLLSDVCTRFAICPLPACRRARGCRGNPTICCPPNAGEFAEMQAAIGDFYLQIQQQRRGAAWQRRRLDMPDPVTRRRPGRR